jgi:hypothetical protein
MVKFKIGFTIESETLFFMMSKFLPVNDLHVEEIVDRSTEQIKLTLPKEKKSPKRVSHFKHSSGRTLQDFILEYMNNTSNYPVTWVELANRAESLGFRKSSINNGVTRLIKAKLIQRISSGKYKLMEK